MFATIAPAIVCMALGQLPPPGPPQGQPSAGSDLVYSPSRSQSVDANFPESRRAEIRELLLYSSLDKGESWNLISRTSPEQSKFTFTTPTDGHYWLRVAVVNRAGKQEPENLFKVQPNWKLVVDTMDPLIKITSAIRQGNDVVVAWDIREDNPDWSSFRIDYKTPGGPPTPVPGQAAPTGETRFTPNTPGPITVLVTLRDRTGHTRTESVDLGGQGIATASNTGAFLPPPTPPVGPAPVMPDLPPVAAPPTTPPSTLPLINSEVLPPNNPAPPPVPQPAPLIQQAAPPPPVNAGTAIPGNPSAQTFTPPPQKKFLAPPPQYGSNWGPTNPKDFQNTPSDPPIASTKDTVQTVQYQTQMIPPVSAPATPRRPLPPLQYVNSPEVMLEYELSKVGPSGVGSVDIFLTQDDGQSWDHVARDDKVVGKTTGGRHHGICELPGDGIYGFTLVVKSQAQIRQEMTRGDQKVRLPKTGDVPEIRVEIDTSAPTAELYPPRRDTTKQNALMLIWTAHDKNLGPTPVTLEWAERREGPWFPIASSIANTGSHSWTLPDRLPVQIYMRLRVKDLAHNEGIAATPEPQLVDLSEPEGRLVNVGVAPPRPR